ncbi:MAG: AMP-binding protein, partial [Alphaproteobacteria bacterium]|nr:AMP-binding protein [Alphaproteobacteria bacterium]
MLTEKATDGGVVDHGQTPVHAFAHAFTSADPKKISLIWANRTLTFADLRRKMDAVAAHLAEEGLAAGDRVALVTREPDAFLCCFAACLAHGLTAVIIDPAAPASESARMLARATPDALVADTSALVQLESDHADVLPAVGLTVGDASKGRNGFWSSPLSLRRGAAARWPRYGDLDQETVPGQSFPDLAKDLPAYIMFTSGTTSQPKAVVISRRALFRHLATLAQVFDYDEDARMLHYLALHHTDGLVHGPAASIVTGMTVVSPGGFSADALQDLPNLLHRHRITHFQAVPTMLAIIRRLLPERQDLFQTGAFRHLISTAGYLNEGLWRDFQEHYDVRVSNFYGMTETVSGSLYCGPSNEIFRFNSLGKPVDATLRIVAEDGAILPPGTEGELQIAGDHVMTGYLDDADATSDVLKDGWLSTGDLFRVDEAGFYSFVGRKKNIIKRGGITVYPEDIQKLVADLPGVREAEVLGMPDPEFEEIIVVCAAIEADASADAISAACTAGLAPERRPDRIVLMDSLPRGPSGKVQRDALVAALADRADPAESATDGQGDLESQIIDIAADVLRTDSADINTASTPDTLDNWDSYAHLELVMSLEKAFGISLSPKDV